MEGVGNAGIRQADRVRPGRHLDVAQAARELARCRPQEVLAWASDTFADRCAMSSSFQTQSLPLLHMVSKAAPDMRIVFLDTGYHFLETLAFRDRLAAEWGLNVVTIQGDKAQEYGETLGRRPLHETAPDRCCLINKVQPMSGALERYDAWISGVRRDQTADRGRFDTVASTTGGKVRIHPMLSWTSQDVERYIQDHDLPRHPLTDAGFASIGCAPCTQPAADRSGRWNGRDKTECGLHLNPE